MIVVTLTHEEKVACEAAGLSVIALRFDCPPRLSRRPGSATDALTEANVRLREVLVSLTKSHDELKATQMQLIDAKENRAYLAAPAARFVSATQRLAQVMRDAHLLTGPIEAAGLPTERVLVESQNLATTP